MISKSHPHVIKHIIIDIIKLYTSISNVLWSCRFGDSTGSLTVSLLAFPTKWIILIGALLSTIGAGLQTLTGLVMVICFHYEPLLLS